MENSYIPVNIAGAPYSTYSENPNLLSHLMISMKQKFSEMDIKYLDKTEGDQFYINKPITANIDMKNKKNY